MCLTTIDPSHISKGKVMKKSLVISVLVCVLICSANAGEIPNGADPVPTSTPQISSTATTDGDIPNGVTAQGVMPNGITASAALNVLESLLLLF